MRYMNFWITDEGKFGRFVSKRESLEVPWTHGIRHAVTIDLKTGEVVGVVEGEPLAVLAMIAIECPEVLTGHPEKAPMPSSSDPSAP